MNDVRLFTLDGAARHDPAVRAWFAAPPAQLRGVAQRWFQAMRAAGPDVHELLHDGCPTVCVEDLALGYVNTFAAHVNVGFFFGAVLCDDFGLLEGTGRFMRHVKVRPGSFEHDAALQALILDAYQDVKARLAARRSP